MGFVLGPSVPLYHPVPWFLLVSWTWTMCWLLLFNSKETTFQSSCRLNRLHSLSKGVRCSVSRVPACPSSHCMCICIRICMGAGVGVMQVRSASDISVFLECPVPHILILEHTVSAGRAGHLTQGYPSFAFSCPGLQVECHGHPGFTLALQIQMPVLALAKPVPYAASHLPTPGTLFLFFPLGKGPRLCTE